MRTRIRILLTAFGLLLGPAHSISQPVWVSRQSLPTPRTGACAVEFEGKIYVIGGRGSQGQILKVVERYDPVKDRWEVNVPPLKRPLENAAAVVFNGTIYVLGGRDNKGEVKNEVVSWNRQRNRWEEQKEMKEEREGLTAVVLDGRLYAIGGLGEDDDQETFLRSVEYLEEDKEEWKISEDWRLDFARASFATVVVRDSAFSLGGFSTGGPLDVVQRYHPAAGTQQKAVMPTPRGGLAAVAREDTIFVFGGRSPADQVLNTVEFYLPETNRWHQAQALSLPREGFAAVAVDGVIYLFGGRDEDGNVLDSVEAARARDVVTFVPPAPSAQPEDFALEQNYPNPFNPETRIEFSVPAGNRDLVRLRVYNLLGQVVRTLLQGPLASGRYAVTWDGRDDLGRLAASGVYLYTLEIGSRRISRRMTLLR